MFYKIHFPLLRIMSNIRWLPVITLHTYYKLLQKKRDLKKIVQIKKFYNRSVMVSINLGEIIVEQSLLW